MDDNKRKHLEFAQTVITRMANNSFLIKGWVITLVSALYALAVKEVNVNFAYIPYFAIPIFWVLDGFYLSQERQYRDLYDVIRVKKEEDINFNMKTAEAYPDLVDVVEQAKIAGRKSRASWLCSIFGNVNMIFYFLMLALTFGILFLLKK